MYHAGVTDLATWAGPELLGFVLTLALALLIGFEREELRGAHDPGFFGGVRTFPLIALVGHLLWLAFPDPAIPYAVGLLVLGALLVVSHHASIGADRSGITTEMAALLTYAIGAAAAARQYWAAVAAGIVAVLLLHEKQRLEWLATHVPRREIGTLVRFLLLSGVILPVVPNRPFTRFEINPFTIWLVVVAVSGLSVDSRDVREGHLFAALPGVRMHGGEFISFALRMGAAAVLTDRRGAEIAAGALAASEAALVIDDTPRRALALAAAAWFGAQPEVMVAVTGTNGKTSVASFTRQIWEALGLAAVNFGTTGVEGHVAAPLAHTTPEPLALHRLLAGLHAQGVGHGAMEASSHGLAQHRLDGVRLRAAGFTNLTRDHLDYHADLDRYFEAKAGLFGRVLPADGTAVVNVDDPRGAGICAIAARRGQRLIRVGRKEGADLRLLGQRFDATGQEIRFSHAGRAHMARLSLIGGFQADNVLLAAGLALACEAAPERVFAALEGLTTVSGRMQLAAMRGNGASVFVDYAHTPAALETALAALRPHVMGRLVVVFGAGGDRDPGKRAPMGRAAAAGADMAIVTDDNPRSEDPARIRAAIRAGCPEATEIGDRALAILTGVDALGPGDALLIAGKGHETGQIVGDDVLDFNDAEQASIAVAALERRGA